MPAIKDMTSKEFVIAIKEAMSDIDKGCASEDDIGQGRIPTSVIADVIKMDLICRAVNKWVLPGIIAGVSLKDRIKDMPAEWIKLWARRQGGLVVDARYSEYPVELEYLDVRTAHAFRQIYYYRKEAHKDTAPEVSSYGVSSEQSASADKDVSGTHAQSQNGPCS